MADETLAENLRRMLREKGWAYRELERRAGLGSGTVSHMLNGPHNPSVANLRRIVYALGCSWDDLME